MEFDAFSESYALLIEFIESNDLAQEENFEYVASQVDMDNYIDYTITELFFSNYDWPGNNIKAWRNKPSGKWRWILYDLDAGFFSENHNMLLHATKNDSTVS